MYTIIWTNRNTAHTVRVRLHCSCRVRRLGFFCKGLMWFPPPTTPTPTTTTPHTHPKKEKKRKKGWVGQGGGGWRERERKMVLGRDEDTHTLFLLSASDGNAMLYGKTQRQRQEKTLSRATAFCVQDLNLQIGHSQRHQRRNMAWERF